MSGPGSLIFHSDSARVLPPHRFMGLPVSVVTATFTDEQSKTTRQLVRSRDKYQKTRGRILKIIAGI